MGSFRHPKCIMMFVIKYDPFVLAIQILSELSDWNDYLCSKETRKYWLQISGGDLTLEEQKYLSHFANMMRRAPSDTWFRLYSGAPKWTISAYKRRQWQQILTHIQEGRMNFEPRIKRVIQQHQSDLHYAKQRINRDCRKLDRAMDALYSFLGIKRVNFRAKIVLLLPKVSGYEAWAGFGDTILLMPPRQNSQKGTRETWEYVYATLLHEYGHLVARRVDSLQGRLGTIAQSAPLATKKVLKRMSRLVGISMTGIVEELFFSTLTPEGKLAELVMLRKNPWKISRRAGKFERMRVQFASWMKDAVQARWQKNISAQEYWRVFTQSVFTLR